MKADELLTFLQKIKDSSRYSPNFEELDVVVLLDEPSLGFSANTKIEGINLGFDWDKGKLLIKTSEKIVKRSVNQHVWQLATDLIYRLSQEVRYYKGVARETDLSKTCKRILKQAGWKNIK